MSVVRRLLLDGTALTVYESADISQDYEYAEAVSFRRKANGGLVRRELWAGKLETTVSGRGLVPSGLSAFDFSSTYTLSCIAHRSVSSTSNVITIPAARRSDTGAEPYALVFIDDIWQTTGIDSVSTDEYTITAVAGADLYKLYYFPEITVMSSPPTETWSQGTTPFGWQLVAREV